MSIFGTASGLLSVIGFLILCAVAGLYMMISLRKEDQA